MSIETNDYLRWYIPLLMNAESAVNLHSSGATAFDLDGVTPDKTGGPWDRLPRLEGKLARWLGIERDEVCFASGATGGTLHALMTLAGQNDEFLVEAPIYEPMRRQAARLGTLKRFECKMEDGWKLPLKDIEGKLTPKTGAVLITEPSNPSGTCRSREDILALADMAAKHGAILLINEVYRGFTENESFHRQRKNIVVVSSFSKLLGFYGLRFGWLSGEPETIGRLKAAGMNMSMHPLNTASMGLALFGQVDELRRNILDISAAGTPIVESWVNATDDVSWTKPEGPGFGCIKLPDRFSDDVEFTKDLYKNHDVFVIPGTFFEVPGTIRISWLQAGDRLEEGLAGITKQLAG